MVPPSDVATAVGDEVRVAMTRSRISQTALAQAVGMSQAAMNRRVRGVVPFNVVELAAVAEVLGVPMYSFLQAHVIAA